MQRVATIERSGVTEGPIKAVWDNVFLNMIYTMCTTVRPEAPEVVISTSTPFCKQWLCSTS